jgi:hypothetical protein
VTFKNSNKILQRAILYYDPIASFEFLAEIYDAVGASPRLDDGNDLVIYWSGIGPTETNHAVDTPRETNLMQHAAGIKASENILGK